MRICRLALFANYGSCTDGARLIAFAKMRSIRLLLLVLASICFSFVAPASAQSNRHILYGDVRVDESKVTGLKPISFDLLLYNEMGTIVARQSASNNGRYRFNDLPGGRYNLVVELENREIARVRVDFTSPLIEDLKQDLLLEWKPADTTAKGSTTSAADAYDRKPANQTLFDQALDAFDKQHYDQAAELLRRIVNTDPRDFQAWTQLANVHFLRKDFAAAENEYLRAIDSRPGFFLAVFNLGRLEITMKNYDVAIEVLGRAVKLKPDSADANYFLGEAYLQIKKGSAGVTYLNEAIRLDPGGMAEVHLRLAALYNGAGLKDKAAVEYEQFLKKRPDYQDRKKLEKYIAENKKP